MISQNCEFTGHRCVKLTCYDCSLYKIKQQEEKYFMRCAVRNCLSNEDGYCIDSSYVSIDENGECDLIVIKEEEEIDGSNNTPDNSV